MGIRNSRLKISLLITLIHFVIGNAIGMSASDLPVLEVLFLPYTFIAGMSQFAGWDGLSIALEIFSFLLMMAVFYPIGALVAREKSK
jgi:hypothetical protein